MTGAGATRRLGLPAATALVISHTIAVGIFLTPAELIGALASPLLTFGVWLTGGLMVLAGAFTFGELASRFPQGGGLYVYLREAWGPRVAFLYGWQSLLIMDPGVTAALAMGASEYMALLWPGAAGRERLVAAAVIWLLALCNMAGLTIGTRLFGALTVLKLGTLGAIIVGAVTLGAGTWSHFVPLIGDRTGAPPIAEAVALGFISVFFSFGGFWETARIAGEVDNPRRTLPRALIIGVTCVTGIYVLTTLAFIYLVPISAATSAADFARYAGESLLGSSGPPLLALAVVLSVVPSAMAMIMVSPRLYEAMALDGLFPSGVAARHPGTGAPVRATALLASLATVLVLLGTFEQIVAFFVCSTLVFLGLAAAAVFVVRRRGETTGFPTPGYPATPLLFLLLVVAIMGMIALNRPVQAVTGLVIVLLGLPAQRVLSVSRAPRIGDKGRP